MVIVASRRTYGASQRNARHWDTTERRGQSCALGQGLAGAAFAAAGSAGQANVALA